MATKGYHEYRGRGRGGKTLLVILLLLILLGAVAFLVVQRYLTYNDDGSVSLELPFFQSQQDGEPGKIPDTEIDIQREDPPAPPVVEPQPLVLQPIHATELSYNCLYRDPAGELEGVEQAVVNVKRVDGTIAYHTAIQLPENVLRGNEATLGHLQAITSSGRYTVARMAVMCDNAYAAAVPEAALTNTWGGQWTDDYNRFWLDPSKAETVDYLCTLAKECAQLGFDEILLDQLRYPIEGNLANTTLSGDTDRAGTIKALAEKIREAVGPSVAVSILLPGGMGSDDTFDRSGLPIEVLTEQFDRIYVPEGSWAYHWVVESVGSDFDRSTRLVKTAAYATDGSYMITQ